MKTDGMIALLLLVGITSLPVSADSAVWPTQGGSPARTGTGLFAGPEQGCITWRFETGGPISASIAIGQAGILYLPSEDGFVYAVDPNGVQVWSYHAGSAVTASPALDDDGTLYIGTRAGTLHAVDPNGHLKWSFPTQGGIYAAPAVTDDKVVVGSLDGSLYALDRDGNTAWVFSPDHPDSIVAAPGVGPDGTIYVGRLYDPNLYALDPADGSIRWHTDLSHTVIPDDPGTNRVRTGFQIAPVFHPDGWVLASTTHDRQLHALDPADGDVEWSLDLYQPPQKPLNATIDDTVYQDNYGYSDIWSEPAIGPDGTIYVSMDDMFLRAVNPAGTLKWNRRIGMYGGLTMTVGADGLICAAADDNSLYVIEPDSGNIISMMTSFGTKLNPITSVAEEWLSFPVLGGPGLLYISSSAGELYAIQAGNCPSKALHWLANLNADQRVNIEDLARLADEWQICLDTVFPGQMCYPLTSWYPLNAPYPKADLNRDFYVNMDDVSLFVEQWLLEENL